MANLVKHQPPAARARPAKAGAAARSRPAEPPAPEEIAARAYALWQESGCPAGRDLDHWLQAERELRG